MGRRNRRSSLVEAYNVYNLYHKDQVNKEEAKMREDAILEEEESSGPLTAEGPKVKTTATPDFPMFRQVPKTGVIYATSRASKYGFSATDESWANMGQGAPETEHLEGAPPRNYTFSIADEDMEYAPTTGLHELREKVATYYNHLYRKGKASQYTADNVCIVPGGRGGITRIMAVLGETQIGYFSPDYTAYEQALGLFSRLSPSPFVHRNVNEALMDPEEFEFQVRGRGTGCILLSNPANPTGQSIEGEALKKYVETARSNQTAVIMDEFYSHYYYDGEQVSPEDGGADDDSNWPKTVSSAAYIDDVNADPILIVNGLTKNWRCPGFRICWIVAPKKMVNMLGSAGSYLEGGANAPLQRLSLPLMELDFIRRDTWTLQKHFKMKRDFLLTKLEEMNISVQWKPNATFYVWADISKLPPPLNDCLVFLEECVKHKTICVPGVFFDINPNGTRNLNRSTCISNVRFSYGPPMRNLELGMKHIKTFIDDWKTHEESSTAYAMEKFGLGD